MLGVVKVFIHGLESSSQGTKARFFRERWPEMIIDDYTGIFDERMEKLEARLQGQRNLVIIGSSYGGLMAAVYACRHPHDVLKLILLAPALNLKEFTPYRKVNLMVPTVIFHGKFDTVVPVEEVKRIAERVFVQLNYEVVADDHPLNRVFPTLPWEKLLVP